MPTRLLVTERRSCSTVGPNVTVAERRAPVFGLAFAVILEQQAAAARHQQRVQAGHAAVALHVGQARGEVAIGGDGLLCR